MLHVFFCQSLQWLVAYAVFQLNTKRLIIATADYPRVTSTSHSRILTFLGSNLRISSWRLCSRPWILQDLLNTIPASISMPRKMSLAWRERSESWWIMLVNVWQPTSSSDENKTGFRSLRLPFSSPGLQPSLADSRLTRRGSMVLLWKGIFIYIIPITPKKHCPRKKLQL